MYVNYMTFTNKHFLWEILCFQTIRPSMVDNGSRYGPMMTVMVSFRSSRKSVQFCAECLYPLTMHSLFHALSLYSKTLLYHERRIFEDSNLYLVAKSTGHENAALSRLLCVTWLTWNPGISTNSVRLTIISTDKTALHLQTAWNNRCICGLSRIIE